jgi:hypothetical protein
MARFNVVDFVLTWTLRNSGLKMFPSDIAILIGGPILVSVLLFEANREHKIQLQHRGLFRFPLALLLSTVACLGTAVLYAKVNPYVSSWILGIWP